MHIQIYHGRFVIGINDGASGITWLPRFQPRGREWFSIQIGYQSGPGNQLCNHPESCEPGSLKLAVLGFTVGNMGITPWHETNAMRGSQGGGYIGDVGDDGMGELVNMQPCGGDACTINGPVLHFHSPRLGGWDAGQYDYGGGAGANAGGSMERSMHGQIASFRLWDKVKDGVTERCPGHNPHLIVNYIFDSFDSRLKDRSGNGNDGTMHSTKFSADYPDQICVRNGAQLAGMTDPVVVGEHGTTTVGCSDCEAPWQQGVTTPHQPPVEVNLRQAYNNPVIIAGVPTENGADSAVVRIQNVRRYGEYAEAGISVGSNEYGNNCDGSDCGFSGRMCESSWCFEMFLQEPDCLDQWHADEEVSWIAVESGAWVDNEGTGGFQAGHVSAQGGMWESVRYHVDFDDMAVMTHVQ